MGIVEISIILIMLIAGLALLLYPSPHQKQMRKERKQRKHRV